MTWNLNAPALTRAISADVPDIEENLACLGPYKTLWLPADLFTAYSGTAEGTLTLATTKCKVVVFPFDGTDIEYANCVVRMPENWNRSTVMAKICWRPKTGCSANDKVRWRVAGVAVSDDDTMDATMGTAAGVSDTVLAGEEADLHITGAIGAITIGGTPALGDLILIQVSRDPTHADDDMAEDAEFLGVDIQCLISEEIETVWS